MAAIHKLSVRGVRAFSPEDEEQVISFCFPLTIIVGSNGCGKTTIIESLKYAVTGSLPPGNKSGQAFVHDPKSMGQTSVKANIKLRFTNRAGNPMVVVRSMEVTQKKTSLSFKALDGIIRTTDPNTGQRVSLSHKCTELDRQIPNLMGVSKPILEHVVFCHQEDSSWPLQEGAVLKKRFDDIFDSTRYAKALEAIRKLRLEYTGNVKDIKADQAGLAAHKKAAEGFREEWEEAKETLEQIDDTIATTDEKIEREEQDKEKFAKVLSEIEAIRLRRDEVQQQIDIAVATSDSLRDACDEDWTDKHTEDELKSMLSGFDEKIADDEKRLLDAQKEYRGVQSDIERFGEQKTRIHSELAKLAAERDQHDKDLRQRQRHMEEMGNKYALDLDVSQTQSTYGGTYTGGIGTQQSLLSQATTGRPSLDTIGTGRTSIGGMTGLSQETLVTMTGDDMAAFQNALTKKRSELQHEKDEHHTSAMKEQDDLVKKLSDLNARTSTINAEREKLKSKMNEALKELQRIKSSSGYAKIRKGDIDDAKKAAAKAVKDADTANNDPRMNVIPQEIRAHEDKINKLKSEIENDQTLVVELRKHEDLLREMTMLKRQIEDETAVIEEGLQDNSFILHKYQVNTSIEGGDPDDDRHLLNVMEEKANAINDKFLSSKDALSRATDARNAVQQRVSEKAAVQSHNQRQLNNLRNQSAALNAPNRGVQRIENAVKEIQNYEVEAGFGSTVPSGTDPQALVQHLTDRLQECQEDKDSPDTIVRTMKKLKKLAKKTGEDGRPGGIACPCCDRSMNPDEAQVFKERMTQLMDPVNSDIVKADEKRSTKYAEAIQNFTKWRDEVSKSINDYLDYKRVSSEITALEGPVQNNERDLKQLEAELKETNSEVETETENTAELRTLLEAMNRLRDEASKIAQKKAQIKDKEETIGTNVASDKDLETVERDLSRRSREKEDLMTAIGDLNKESAELNSRAKQASDKASLLEKRAKEKEDRYNEEQKSSVRRNELNDLINSCRDEENKLESECDPLRRQIYAKESDLKRMRQSNKLEEDRLNDNLNQFTSACSKLDDLNAKIEKYLESNKQEALDRLNQDLAEHDEKMTEKKRTLKDMTPELNALKKKLDDQARHKKNLENNLKVFHHRAEEKRLNSEATKIDEELDLIEGSDTSQQEYNRACAKIRKYEDDKNEAKGRRSGIKDQIKQLKRKLNTEDYKDIDERHRQCMIKLGTTEACVEDLAKYYKALDNALLRYHGMKIADINKIIRELWSLTYKGEDISNIQLVSGAEGAAKSARSYNYRVVMTKGNSQLDMRGRCSAGQRVLASIVIRLALAETFCLNCGVMALDEPTTNLDYANKRGLAIALAQIIASRAIQSNFQLVIITHDEDFVSMMKNELSAHTGFNMPERYFQICREESSDGKFYSKIHAIDWDEI